VYCRIVTVTKKYKYCIAFYTIFILKIKSI
jgi:hypothetical protein